MNIIEVPIEKIANWKDNPKSIKEEDLKRLKYQIKELGVYKPLLVTRVLKKDNAGQAKYISLGGNQRLKAFAELKTSIIPCSLVKADIQKKRIEYSLSDNDQMGRYESDLLNDLILPEMDNLDLDMFKLDLGELTGLDDLMGQLEGDGDPLEERVSLVDRFIVPPFSILDARQGYWQNRKTAWLALGIQSELGRGGAC